MASIESKLFYFFLRLIKKKKFLELQFAFGKFDFYDSREPPKEISKVCNVEKRQLHGRNVFILTPKTKKSGVHILYLHGGAYVQNFVKQHWKFLAMLVERTHCTITAPDYPLAPKYTYVDAFEMVIPLYKEIMLHSEGHTILMGDSAGGGFALALAQRMKSGNTTQPEKIILLSPWLDITLSNPEIKKISPVDPFLSVVGLRKAGQCYAGNSDLENFMLSPINGPLEQLGPISIFVGSKDIFVADTRKLVKFARKRGISINYREYPDMVHVWMLLNFQESKAARHEIVSLITEKGEASSPSIDFGKQ
jgi:acetyl esterase/lipase